MNSGPQMLRRDSDSHSVSILLCRWAVGIALGTGLIAVSSPLFVRSYLPLNADPVRGIWTLPSGTEYRWRSEGYANTSIGPHGMPGKTVLQSQARSKPSEVHGIQSDSVDPNAAVRIALWGDSQAEGVAVDDADKLFAKVEQASQGKFDVYPLARSGEDAADWVTQMGRVEEQFDIDGHVILVVEPGDLLAAVNAPVAAPNAEDMTSANAALAARLPAFVIQAARNVLREADGATPRRLRFGLGPAEDNGRDSAASDAIEGSTGSSQSARQADRLAWMNALKVIRNATDLPVVLLYAPLAPHIVAGEIQWKDPTAEQFLLLKAAAGELGISLLDARAELRDSVESNGQWPHGFHHGRIGSGHLNEVGNRILADKLIEELPPLGDALTLPSVERGD